MIDIHCHILPNIDDGVKSVEEAIALARAESDGRTRVMIATPHVNTVGELERSPELLERVARINEDIASQGIDLRVVAGAELYPMMAIITGIERGLPLTLGGTKKYVLLDTPRASLPLDLGTLMFELLAVGITPILAHPERTMVFQQDPSALRSLLDRGAVCQVNVASLKGKYGPVAKEIAMLILKRRWAHFLASDAHGPKPYGTLGRAVDELKSELPEDYIAILVEKSGAAILNGAPLPHLQPVEYERPKPSLASRLFGSRR